MNEKIDVLNELGEFTGDVATIDECHSTGYWHRAVYAFIVDKDLNGKTLDNIIIELTKDNKKLQEMGSKSRQLSIDNVEDRIYAEIEEVLKND